MSLTLIPLKNEDLAEAGIPFKANTLRGWRKRRKNMKIFTKVEGKVFVIKEKWDELVKKGIGKVKVGK
jgi:hypothetical protein